MKVSYPRCGARLIRVSCAFLFVAFTFAYVFHYQADLIAANLHALTGGAIVYNEWVGAFAITSLLYLLKYFINRLLTFDGPWFVGAYVPSFVVLALITGDFTDPHADTPLFTFRNGALLAICLLYVVFFGRYQRKGDRKSFVFVSPQEETEEEIEEGASYLRRANEEVADCVSHLRRAGEKAENVVSYLQRVDKKTEDDVSYPQRVDKEAEEGVSYRQKDDEKAEEDVSYPRGELSKSEEEIRLATVSYVLFAVLMLLTVFIGNNDKIFHCRLKIERELLANRPLDALQEGKKMAEADSSLTSLRIFALSKAGLLGEKLFEYPIVGKSDVLFPNQRAVRWVILPDSLLLQHLFGLNPSDLTKKQEETEINQPVANSNEELIAGSRSIAGQNKQLTDGNRSFATKNKQLQNGFRTVNKEKQTLPEGSRLFDKENQRRIDFNRSITEKNELFSDFALRTRRKAACDYLLTACLLDKNLNQFALIVRQLYADIRSLPKHYREALILYTHLRSNPVIIYKDDVLDADFKDFQELDKKFSDKNMQRNAVQQVYGNTYWYYYFFQE